MLKLKPEEKIENDKWKVAHSEDIQSYFRHYDRADAAESRLETIKVPNDEAAYIMSAYHVSLRKALELVERKKAGCEACGSMLSLCIDHEHATGHVRGILCASCNTALGFLKDSPKTIKNLARYVALWRSKN